MMKKTKGLSTGIIVAEDSDGIILSPDQFSSKPNTETFFPRSVIKKIRRRTIEL